MLADMKPSCVGRIGALAVTLGVGISIVSGPGVAVAENADTTALILCGTTCPTPDQFWIESIGKQFVGPTHPGPIDYVGVTAPMEFWPITGIFRVLGALIGPPEIWGPGGPGWPDESLWKLSGLFDLSGDQSLAGGVAALQKAMTDNPNDHQVIYGNSQGAGIANVVKKNLAAEYPKGAESPEAPDIDFVLGGDPNLPNGGLMSRFPGLYIPILDLSFNGAAATDTQFDTVEINRQYDGFSDFPLYPLNLVATLNAILGIFYVHAYGLDVSLPDEPQKNSTAYQDTHGDTSYYFFETPDLPLFGPLRTLGVPEQLIDVVEPFFRVLVELGYDRTIPAWQPTPARLIPVFDPIKLVVDLVGAVGEGIDNALAIVGLPPLFGHPETATVAPDRKAPAAFQSGTESATTADDRTEPTSAPETAEVGTMSGAGAAEPEVTSEDDPEPAAMTPATETEVPAGTATEIEVADADETGTGTAAAEETATESDTTTEPETGADSDAEPSDGSTPDESADARDEVDPPAAIDHDEPSRDAPSADAPSGGATDAGNDL